MITQLIRKHFAPNIVMYYHTENRIRIGCVPFDYGNEDFEKIAKKAID